MARKKDEIKETPASENTTETGTDTTTDTTTDETTAKATLREVAEDMQKVMELQPAIDMSLDDEALEAKVRAEAKQVVKEDHPDHPLSEKDKQNNVSRFQPTSWDFLLAGGYLDHIVPPTPKEDPAKPKGKGKGKGAAAGTTSKPRGSATPGKGPGVIAGIQTILNGTSKAAPLSKAEILAKLVAMFPDREADSMKSTVQAQVPARMAKEKSMKIITVDGKYYVEK